MEALIIGYGSAGKRHAKILSVSKKIKKIYIKTNQKIDSYSKFNFIKKINDLNPDIIDFINGVSCSLNMDPKKLLLINRKYNTQINNMQAQIDNLLSIRIAIEGSLMTKNVFDTIQESSNALKSTMPTLDKVEDILADTEESISQTIEITEALSTPIQIGMPVDPDELDDELRELMSEENVEPELNLPNVPTTEFPKINVPNTVKSVNSIDNELAELLAFVN